MPFFRPPISLVKWGDRRGVVGGGRLLDRNSRDPGTIPIPTPGGAKNAALALYRRAGSVTPPEPGTIQPAAKPRGNQSTPVPRVERQVRERPQCCGHDEFAASLFDKRKPRGKFRAEISLNSALPSPTMRGEISHGFRHGTKLHHVTLDRGVRQRNRDRTFHIRPGRRQVISRGGNHTQGQPRVAALNGIGGSSLLLKKSSCRRLLMRIPPGNLESHH